MKSNGKIVLDGFVKGKRKSDIKPVLDLLVECRILIRAKCGSDYDSMLAPTKMMLQDMMKTECITALYAMMRLVKEMEIQSAELGVSAPEPKMMVMAAALDLAEAEEGWFETDHDDIPDDIGYLG